MHIGDLFQAWEGYSPQRPLVSPLLLKASKRPKQTRRGASWRALGPLSLWAAGQAQRSSRIVGQDCKTACSASQTYPIQRVGRLRWTGFPIHRCKMLCSSTNDDGPLPRRWSPWCSASPKQSQALQSFSSFSNMLCCTGATSSFCSALHKLHINSNTNKRFLLGSANPVHGAQFSTCSVGRSRPAGP